jgi:hypothetical protein
MGRRLMTFDMVVPHLPQISSVDGYDIITYVQDSKRSSKTTVLKSIDIKADSIHALVCWISGH